MLLLAACFCIYRWHTHRNPPVVTIKASSPDGSFHTAGSGLLRSPASSVAPGSGMDGREGSNSSLAGIAVRPGSLTSMQRGEHGRSPTAGSPNCSGAVLAPRSTGNTKSHMIDSLSSATAAGGGGVISHVSLGAAGTTRSWLGTSPAATGSSHSTRIPRGLPARCSGAESGTSKTSSKGGSAAYDSVASGSDHAALECVRAEVHAAVQQLQACSPQGFLQPCLLAYILHLLAPQAFAPFAMYHGNLAHCAPVRTRV